MIFFLHRQKADETEFPSKIRRLTLENVFSKHFRPSVINISQIFG